MSDSSIIKDDFLTETSHNDSDKHYIGEALPAASNSELSQPPYSVVSTVGTSVFPARADHTHDTPHIYANYYQSSFQTIPPGSAYLNNFIFNGGYNMLNGGSTQLFVFPKEGMYEYSIRYALSRSSGAFNNYMYLVFRAYYHNASFSNVYQLTNCNEGLGAREDSFTTHDLIGTIGPGYNVQFLVENPDSVNWFFKVSSLMIRRVCSTVSGLP